MGNIADLSQLLNTLTGGTAAKEQIFWYQDNRQGSAAGAVTVVGKYTSLWSFNMFPGGAGAAPGGTARNPTNATSGTLMQANPGGGRQKYLAGFAAQSNPAGILMLYDRLADFSGLNATTTTAQNTTSLAVSRYTGAESAGNQIWIEIYTLIGATATTVTVEYTNQAGTTSKTSLPIVFGGTGSREATRMLFVPLAAGDTGVRSVESVTVLATTGTAGDFGVTIARPLVNAPIAVNGSGVVVDLLTKIPSLPEIKTDAALSFMWFASISTSPTTSGTLSMVEA